MKTAFTAGNFDLLHPGYIITFEEAKNIVISLLFFYKEIPLQHDLVNINQLYHYMIGIKL